MLNNEQYYHLISIFFFSTLSLVAKLPADFFGCFFCPQSGSNQLKMDSYLDWLVRNELIPPRRGLFLWSRPFFRSPSREGPFDGTSTYLNYWLSFHLFLWVGARDLHLKWKSKQTTFLVGSIFTNLENEPKKWERIEMPTDNGEKTVNLHIYGSEPQTPLSAPAWACFLLFVTSISATTELNWTEFCFCLVPRRRRRHESDYVNIHYTQNPMGHRGDKPETETTAADCVSRANAGLRWLATSDGEKFFPRVIKLAKKGGKEIDFLVILLIFL